MRVDAIIYFISEHPGDEIFHGGIGPVDIEKILLAERGIQIRFPYHFDFSIKAKLSRFWYLVKIYLKIKPGAVVLFQHPLYTRMSRALVFLVRFKKQVQLICLLADIDGLKDGNSKLLEQEKSFFKKFKYFIVHNSNMKVWLQSFHPEAKTSSLQWFDFLSTKGSLPRSKSTLIVFAGNLNKSLFLEKLHEWVVGNSTLKIHLYGPGVTDGMLKSTAVEFKGLHHPYSLPGLIQGSFGLIWDGDGLHQPSGSLGDYMKYITHHKLSLYVLANLPVIVHHSAGSAELVKKHNIGFTITSLFEIEQKIMELSDQDYEEMVQNTHALAKKIRSGAGLRNALQEILDEIDKDDGVANS
jgi:hypothetical protein